MRKYSLLDKFINEIDRGLNTLSGSIVGSRELPTNNNFKVHDKNISASKALMRVNHVGEVCAQALYYGQSLTTKNNNIKNFLIHSAKEEEDHLDWCQQRLQQLNGRLSLLNPVWYSCSFILGAIAGMSGDAWGLGFVRETEKQVEQHLKNHLKLLPEEDLASKEIIMQMIRDESEHAQNAAILGAKELPNIIKDCMKMVAKVMTTTAYWI